MRFKILIVFILWCLLLVTTTYSAYNVKTLANLQADVRYCLATDADPYHPNDTLTAFINIACREVASYGAIIKMDSVIVSAEDQRLTLNTDVLEVSAVFPCSASGVQSLKRIEYRGWGWIEGSSQSSVTRFYAFQPVGKFVGGDCYEPSIWLYPAHSGADDTLTVVYYAQANELSATTDTTLIPYQYTPLVVYYATALAYARAHNFNEANWWFALYDRTRQEKGMLYQLDYIIHPKEINK